MKTFTTAYAIQQKDSKYIIPCTVCATRREAREVHRKSKDYSIDTYNQCKVVKVAITIMKGKT